MTAAQPNGRTPLWEHAGALLLFVVVTIGMVQPLVRDPVTTTIGWEGDNAFCIRQFWWVKHAIVDLGILPFRDPSTYYPVGHNVVNGELFPATTLPAIPITILWGPVVAYNLTLLFTFVMTGFGTYLWIRGLTGSAAGGLVAGVIAAFLPYRFAHLQGHLHMVSTHWIPFALYAFDRFLDQKTLRRGALLGLFVALVALSSWYYAYAIGLMLPVYALVRSRPWREQWNAGWWQGLGVAGLVAAVLVLPFLIPYIQLRASGGLTRGIGEMEAWSINFYDFFLPNRLNPAWAGWMLEWFPHQSAQWVERGVSLGFTAVALALVAVAARRRHAAIAALLAVWVVSFLIALGPTIHIGDRQLLVPVPLPIAALAARALGLFPSLEPVSMEILRQQALAIPLPSMFMYLFVPMTSGMRVMARFGVWTGLMTAGLAGFGVHFLIAASGARTVYARVVTVAAVIVLSTLVLAESHSRLAVTGLRPRAVDQWLAEQPPGAVIDMPLDQALRPLQDYYKTVHQQPTVFGPIGDGFFPPMLEERKATLRDFPSQASVAALEEWGVTWVLLTPSQAGNWPELQARIETTSSLRFDREIGGVLVYRVR